MSLPKKGSRKIVVNEQSFRYIISGNDGYIAVIIEAENTKGQRLHVAFDYGTVAPAEITPAIIKKTIETGLQKGWKPFEKGKELHVSDGNHWILTDLSGFAKI